MFFHHVFLFFLLLCQKLPQTQEAKVQFRFFSFLCEMVQLCENVRAFYGLFPAKAHYKGPICANLSQHLSKDFLECLGINRRTVTRYRQKYADGNHHLFTLRYPMSSFRESIPDPEVNGITDWALTVVTGKSGSSSETYVSSYAKQQIHEYFMER